jgi:membrane protein DedA with SNARE-associated domain
MVKMDDKFLIPRTSKIKFQIFKGIGFIELLIIFFSLSFSFSIFYTLKELFILNKILIFVVVLVLTILLIIPFSENKKG